MNRTFKAILAVIFVFIIAFSGISICQNIFRSAKIDLTERKIYTLSDGTRSILAKLNQPVDIRLYYAKTAAMKAPDAIRRYNDYYFFVKALLEEYAAEAKNNVNLQVIDPRPFSEEEEEALRYGLKRFQITEDESFFFGMVVRTPYGASKSIEFFTPDRQNFVEYDISYLIDSLLTREKRKIGVLSSLPVMGDDMSGYMAQMMQMQGKKPRAPWAVVQQLKQRYEVSPVEADTREIKDVDLLMVIHPKSLPEKTLFAIDQFVLRGGRTIVCVDPHCFADQPDPQARMTGQMPSSSSTLNRLMKNWGIEMPDETFAGDDGLAMTVPLQPNRPAEKLIGFLNLTQQGKCYSPDNIISANLNQVRVLFSGVLKQIDTSEVKKKDKEQDKEESDTESQSVESEKAKYHFESLLQTTSAGNTWKVRSPYDLMMPSGKRLMGYFTEGTKPVTLACLVTGRFKSSFPDGIDVPLEAEGNDDKEPAKNEDSDKPKTAHITGLLEPEEGTDCAVAVFADVDFISDSIAYQQTFFGPTVSGDNSALLLNTIENLSGSGDLIAIRSRGNFRRPFTRVDEIEKAAEKETADEEAMINEQIKNFQKELNDLISKARNEGQTLIDASGLAVSKEQVERKIRKAQIRLREVQNQRRKSIEAMGVNLRNFNMFLAPAVILLIAILLSVRRRMLRRRYISHASDA